MEPPNASGTETPLPRGRFVRWLAWLLRLLRWFFDAIGLYRAAPRVEHDAQIARFRLHHTAFRKLLGANDSFLRTMAAFEERRAGREPVDAAYARRACVRMAADVHRMIDSLNEISDDRYRGLGGIYDRITASLSALLDGRAALPTDVLCLDLEALGREHAHDVGRKLANLAEVRNRVGLPTPDGFALTIHAYRQFAAAAGIEQAVAAMHEGLQSDDDVERVSALLSQRIYKAEVPKAVREAIAAGYARLAARQGHPVRVAVRSSALREDEECSFAGQYVTLLNVAADDLVDAWREVVASLYSREAVHYRRFHGIAGDRAAMAVGFVQMVPAAAAGIAYTRDPGRPDEDVVLVQAVHGLGATLADGSVSAETLTVRLGAGAPTVERLRARQSVQLRCDDGGKGLVEEVVATESLPDGVISEDEALAIARWARALEAHFGSAQDVEWALDEHRRTSILQSRPLRLAELPTQAAAVPEGVEPLLVGGETARPGVASGIVVHIDEDADLGGFPVGAVLVAKRSSPKYVGLMQRVAAIVTDAGSTTGHMASLAREFGVPTLIGLDAATRVLREGQLVTVDATARAVYPGAVAVQAGDAAPAADHVGEGRVRRRSPADRLLSRAAELLVPLTLTDPTSANFRPEACTSLHDIARFVHEKSYEEMFRMGEELGDIRSAAYLLDVFLPIDLYLIDLGGGITPPARGNRVKRSQVVSAPLSALLTGMLHPKIPRWGARPIDTAGFASIVMRHALTSPEQERTFRDPSYAIVSDRYLNYTARVGYHFGVVDSHCGDTANKNYVSLLFRGGAADAVRRGRRARAIAGIVKEWGMSAHVEGDSVTARISKTTRKETARVLELVGRLLQFMRQMDVAMKSERAVALVRDAFLREDYALEGLGADARVDDDAPSS